MKTTQKFRIGQGGLADHFTWLQPIRDKFQELKPLIEEKLANFENCFEEVYYEDWFNGFPYLIIKVKGEPTEQLDDFGTFCYSLGSDNIELFSELPAYIESSSKVEEIVPDLYRLEKVLKQEVTPILKGLQGMWDAQFEQSKCA